MWGVIHREREREILLSPTGLRISTVSLVLDMLDLLEPLWPCSFAITSALHMVLVLGNYQRRYKVLLCLGKDSLMPALTRNIAPTDTIYIHSSYTLLYMLPKLAGFLI